ncbi:SCO family protein [Bordetella genomosp. 9]|uniref:SCO family protein n=1 Tax=Bordetella genomosp. 9 TaxID=1416803 RepID=A0A261R8G0_9BORD|nr:SCO family protein [Bordetella genomosp. 9]OZI21296.1 SCO family protein [Bordetella genomosp. 9]
MPDIAVPRRALLRVFAAAPIASLLAACGQDAPSFKGSDITGTHLGKNLSMVDQDGRPRTLADYAGKVMVVFFGYTQCPDVCPTALAELSQVMQALGDSASRVQVIMVTVDPERDTPEVLKQYVQTFNPSFVGLTGTPEQVKQAASSFKVYYAKVPAKNGKDYSMDHSAAFYLLDTKGEARVLAGNGSDVDSLAHDIKALLA